MPTPRSSPHDPNPSSSRVPHLLPHLRARPRLRTRHASTASRSHHFPRTTRTESDVEVRQCGCGTRRDGRCGIDQRRVLAQETRPVDVEDSVPSLTAYRSAPALIIIDDDEHAGLRSANRTASRLTEQVLNLPPNRPLAPSPPLPLGWITTQCDTAPPLIRAHRPVPHLRIAHAHAQSIPCRPSHRTAHKRKHLVSALAL
ncbi:hypothetical protein K438DRAFT_1972278 [Mycena galopus ATCC 62051]|nr:hypothetical protein K438DRAFT_1972278 [Mycena galopus ATCC 62051]